VTGEVKSHQTKTEMIQSAPREVDAGTDISLKVGASCSCACDLRGNRITVIAQDGAVAAEAALTSFEEGLNETDAFTVKAPTQLGQCTWSIVFPAQEVGGIPHGESWTPVSFTVRPHSTGIAVWDAPSPIALNSRFRIKVGAKCSAGCNLVDTEVRVYGQKGRKVATARLGPVPWTGTSALYWTEAELEAPGDEGYYRWRVRLRKPDLELPHEDASHTFFFTTARPPQHVVTVEVIAEEANTPLERALVVLRPGTGYPYRSYTDEGGVARLEVPNGEYTLYVSKSPEYDTFETTVEMNDDASVKAWLPLAPPPIE